MVIDILKESKALLTGHFLLSSGRHSDTYVQCARLLQYPDKAAEVLSVVADKLKNLEFDMIVGPAMGGIIPAYELGRQTKKKAVFTERENGVMTLRRGFEVEKGQRILISEDVVTTGKSSLETVQVIEGLGGEVIGIACIVDRGASKLDFPIYSAIKLNIENWEKEDCPLCRKGVPYVKPGSRAIK